MVQLGWSSFVARGHSRVDQPREPRWLVLGAERSGNLFSRQNLEGGEGEGEGELVLKIGSCFKIML